MIYSPALYEDALRSDAIIDESGICDPNHYVNESDRNVFILHSSGTTGLPKPIYNSHEYLLGYATCHEFSNVEEAAGLSVTTLPLYHVGCSLFQARFGD